MGTREGRGYIRGSNNHETFRAAPWFAPPRCYRSNDYWPRQSL